MFTLREIQHLECVMFYGASFHQVNTFVSHSPLRCAVNQQKKIQFSKVLWVTEQILTKLEFG